MAAAKQCVVFENDFLEVGINPAGCLEVRNKEENGVIIVVTSKHDGGIRISHDDKRVINHGLQVDIDNR